MKIRLDLRLFEGEGGDGAGVSVDAGQSAEQMGENVQNTTGSAVAEDVPDEPERTPEERRADYEKFKEKYRDLYGADVKEHISRRFKDEHQLHKQLESYVPLMSLLGMRYGIENADVEKVMQAIEADNSFWEEQAMKENMTVDQVKHMRKLEAENRQILEAGQRAQQIRQRDETYARWDREAEVCKQVFPKFDMETECDNPQFIKLLGAGFDITSAYKAVHFDEITQGIVTQTEKNTKKKVADNIRSGSSRPAENGASGPANTTKMNAWNLSDEEFHKVLERVKRGEEVVI